MPPSPNPSYLHALSGDFINKTNVFRMVREFARYSNIDRGYYMEFGVMNGETAITAYRQLRGIVTDVYGFDTFTGHPAPQAADQPHAEYMPYFFEGNYKAHSRQFAETMIRAATMMPESSLHLVEGKFCDTLPTFDKASLAGKGFPVCVMVDCDLYSSAVDVFAFLTDLLKTGTWLLIDDFWTYRGDPKLGVRKAFEDWLETNGRIGVTLYDNFNGFSRAYVCYEK